MVIPITVVVPKDDNTLEEVESLANSRKDAFYKLKREIERVAFEYSWKEDSQFYRNANESFKYLKDFANKINI